MDLEVLYRSTELARPVAGRCGHDPRPLQVLDVDLAMISANPAFHKTFEPERDTTIGVPFYELGNGQWNIDDLRLLLEQVIPDSLGVRQSG